MSAALLQTLKLHGWQAAGVLNVTAGDCIADSVNVLRFRWWHARLSSSCATLHSPTLRGLTSPTRYPPHHVPSVMVAVHVTCPLPHEYQYPCCTSAPGQVISSFLAPLAHLP